MDAGLLLARLVIGLMMAAHGAQKLFGWFGGYGLTGTAGFFEGLGFRPGRLFAATAAVTEIVSGVLVVLGLLGPIGPALMVSVMVVAALTVHWPNVFSQSNGIEYRSCTRRLPARSRSPATAPTRSTQRSASARCGLRR